jgi:hypothetical protein
MDWILKYYLDELRLPRVKENYIDKVKAHFNNQGLYSIIMNNKILLAFLNVETILWLFLNVVKRNCDLG